MTQFSQSHTLVSLQFPNTILSTPRSIWFESTPARERTEMCDLPARCVARGSVRRALTFTLSNISNKCEILEVPRLQSKSWKAMTGAGLSLPSLFPEGSHGGFSTPPQGYSKKDPSSPQSTPLLPAVWPPATYLTSLHLWDPYQEAGINKVFLTRIS